jgi:glycine cleavage system aminomethyltransferase T
VSLAFLSPSRGALARSPMEREALAAGAQLEERDGWNVAVRFDGAEDRFATVAFADMSHLSKLELQRPHQLRLGEATCADGVWTCPFSADRVLLLGERRAMPDLPDAVDVTTAFAALAIAGPLARELFARFTALDLRDPATPVHAFRPGSVARTPGAVLRQTEDRWLMLFGAALGQYMWTVVADAAESLGGGPVGVDALDRAEAAHA